MWLVFPPRFWKTCKSGWYYYESFGPSAPFHTFASASHVVRSLLLAFLLVLPFPYVSQFAAVRWLVAGEWKFILSDSEESQKSSPSLQGKFVVQVKVFAG